jgi:alkylated DNA repair dioxygenase AlkB
MNDITLVKGLFDKSITEVAFKELYENIKWNGELNSLITGEKVKINRKMAYVSDTETVYSYASFYFKGEVWNDTLLSLKNKLETDSKVKFNSVLLNLYENGKDVINWHSDKEDILVENPIIACINLGATRKFWFRKKEYGSVKFSYDVEDGDLLIMGENCQRDYLHAILKENYIKEPRISLTFRMVKMPE